VKCLLNSGPYEIKCSVSPPNFSTITKNVGNYLKESLGENRRCLDEHRHIFPRDGNGGTGKYFSRGAMELMANIPGATVIATYTDVPNLPSRGSSGLCNVPLRLPILDFTKVMKVVPELQLDHACTTSIHSRMPATLTFRLAMMIRALGITSVLYRRNDRFPNCRYTQ